MKQTRLVNICQDLLSRWREKKEIDEEQSYIFFDGILDGFSCPEEEDGPDYRKVLMKLNEMWQYRDFNGLSPEEIFLCGSLWGAIKMAETNQKRLRQQRTTEELVHAYAGKLWFFEAISLRPGIRHKDLAQRGGWSTSQLSQFVTGVVKEGLVSYNRVGREKYYYLQKRGELVYAEIKKNKKYYDSELVGWMNQLKRLESSNDETIVSAVLALERLQMPLSLPKQMMPSVQNSHKIVTSTKKLAYKTFIGLSNNENNKFEFDTGKEEFDSCLEIEPVMTIAKG